MADRDKPKVHFSFSQFEDAEVEEFTCMTKSGKRITFPDIFGMESRESERILRKVMQPDTLPREGAQMWLSKEDFDILDKERLSERHMKELVEAAQAHYEKYWGDPGEDSASES